VSLTPGVVRDVIGDVQETRGIALFDSDEDIGKTAMMNRWDKVAVVMGVFISLAGIMHFANPDFFNDIVPPWLPPSESFWTYASGVAELVVGPMMIAARTRRAGAFAAIALFVGVFPANIYMTWDWRDRAFSEQIVSYGRLPLQFVMIWAAWRVVNSTRTPAVQGDRPAH
jgi:uncharacterized membrane protein